MEHRLWMYLGTPTGSSGIFMGDWMVFFPEQSRLPPMQNAKFQTRKKMAERARKIASYFYTTAHHWPRNPPNFIELEVKRPNRTQVWKGEILANGRFLSLAYLVTGAMVFVFHCFHQHLVKILPCRHTDSANDVSRAKRAKSNCLSLF